MDYTIFRENLKRLVESSGKMAKDLAVEIGMTPTSLSRYLTGARAPELPYVVKIADYFGVTVDWLLGIHMESIDAISPQIREVMLLYSLASDDDKRVVQAVLNKYREVKK